ncbi:hypothetical protein LSTR_LSTR009842 [Laodelphax striatellus]|uniref:Daxx histone-binding domain-containing protein n=1 Tax=Laodelphax striatellus TaxID=195883 RepID=A0A482XQ89_LAOST|nr:hypothetical protein LSTR_LSTR009842 [Laodelphax striatellus]
MEPNSKRIKPTKIEDGTNGKHSTAIEKNTRMYNKLLDSYKEILKTSLTPPILEKLIARAQQNYKKCSTSFKQSSEFTRLLQNQNNLQPLQHFETIFKKLKANKNSSAAKCSSSKDGETPVENENDSVSSDVYNKDLFEKFLNIVKERKLSQGNNYAETEKLMIRAWTSFNNCKSSYKKSAAFEDLLRKAIDLSTVDPSMQLKTVLDELKFNKRVASQQPANESKVSEPGCSTSTAQEATSGTNKAEDESDDEDELSGLDPQVRKKVKMLEKTLRQCNLRIKQLEEREVDFSREDDENSAYMKLDRYQRRFDQVYKKICQLKNQKSDAGRVIKRKVSFPGGEIERAVEKHYNKTNMFPDFHDILKITKEVKKNDKLAPNALHSIAQKVFEEFGRMLQRRRKLDVYESACFYLTNEDPADQDPELKARLEENYVKFKDNEKKVIDMYAEKSQGIEPEEVGSSVSNDEDETEKDETKECDSGDSSDDHGEQSTVMDVDDNDTIIGDGCDGSQEKVQGESDSKGERNKDDESKNKADESKNKADESIPGMSSCSSKDTAISSDPGKTSNACFSKDSEGVTVEGKEPD